MEVHLAIDLREKVIGAAYSKENTLYLLSKTLDDNYACTIDSLRKLIQPSIAIIPSNQKLIDIFNTSNDLIPPFNLEIRPRNEFRFELAKQWLSKIEELMHLDSRVQFDENRLSIGCADMLDKTNSQMGRKLLISWFNFPLKQIEKIKERQDTVEFYYSPSNTGSVEIYKSLLKKLPNVHATWSKIKTESRVVDWKHLLMTLTCFLKIYHVTDYVPESIGFQSIKNKDVAVLKSAVALIEDNIDFEEHSDRLAIKPNIDLELDEMKRTYHGLDSFLSNRAEHIQLPDITAICFTLMGFFICITFENKVSGDIPGLEYKFSNEKCGYYKDPTMLNLDEEIGDIFNLIGDKELAIVQSIREEISIIEPAITTMTDCVARLDCYLALAEVALRFNYVKPDITADDCLVLTDSRHPLEEQFVEFVVNDVQLGIVDTDVVKPKGVLITGPNSSGKSIFIQQIALITFMAHIGSFVPCSYARIGITDKILTRIKTSTSVIKNESSFLVDLKQGCFALSEATERSLVLIDEFGKGTTASDGIGLFCALINGLISKRTRFLATTHFHEIIAFRLLQEGPNLDFYTPRIINEESGIVYLYDIVHGNYTSSLGILCAERVGLPPSVIQRAQLISDAIIKCEPIPPSDCDDKQLLKQTEQLFDRFTNLNLETCDLELALWRYVRQYNSLIQNKNELL
ncbi:MutS protein msh5 [Terramyces sp. JEL0728]|nr:MutS protein msh5 [Terramyces sp. JEL0728]